MSQWYRAGEWTDRRRAVLRLHPARLLTAGMEFTDVCQALGRDRNIDAQKVADRLVAEAAARGWIPEDCFPVALWPDPETWAVCLLLAHRSFAPVPDGDRPPVIDGERGQS